MPFPFIFVNKEKERSMDVCVGASCLNGHKQCVWLDFTHLPQLFVSRHVSESLQLRTNEKMYQITSIKLIRQLQMPQHSPYFGYVWQETREATCR